METNANIIGTVLMYLCLCGLILCGVAIFFATVGGPVLDALRRWLHLDGFGRVCVAVFVCGVSYMGMTKHGTVQHPGADDGITLAEIGIEYSTNTLQTAVEVKYTAGPVTTSTPVSVRMSSTNEWTELEKINPTITTDLATNVLAFAVSGDVTKYPYWWVGSNPPAIIIETTGIKLLSCEATSKTVLLTWTCDDAKATTFSVQRRTQGGDWETVGTVEKADLMSFTYQGFTIDVTRDWRIRTEYTEANQ